MEDQDALLDHQETYIDPPYWRPERWFKSKCKLSENTNTSDYKRKGFEILKKTNLKPLDKFILFLAFLQFIFPAFLAANTVSHVTAVFTVVWSLGITYFIYALLRLCRTDVAIGLLILVTVVNSVLFSNVYEPLWKKDEDEE